MKITKSQLRRIIKEEKARLLERRDKHAPFWPAEGSLQAAKPWLGKAQGRPMMGVGSLSMFQTAEQAARGVANDDYHPDNPKFGPKVEVPVDAPIDWSLYAGHPSLKKNPAPQPPYDVSPASNTGIGYVADDSPIADIENKKAAAAGIKEPKDAEDYEVGRDQYKVEGVTKVKITKKQLRRIIKEAMAGGTPPPTNSREWMEWGISHGLDANLDRSGQVVFYTDDRVVADAAELSGADLERDNMGQFVIYTGAYDKGRAR